MKRIRILTLAILAFGCADPKAEKIDALKRECIAIHDEVMPDWQNIAAKSSELKKWSFELASDSGGEAENQKLKILTTINLLDSAYDAMGDWMREYDPDLSSEVSQDSILLYYQGEKRKVEHVNKLMKLSLKNGEELLSARP